MQTMFARGNRVQQLDLASTRPGDVVHVQTRNSDWYFTRTAHGHFTASDVVGVFLQTNSKGFGQIRQKPQNLRVSRLIEVGEQIFIGNGGQTGAVEEIFLNGERLT